MQRRETRAIPLLSVAFHLAASVRRFLGQLINLFTVDQGETLVHYALPQTPGREMF